MQRARLAAAAAVMVLAAVTTAGCGSSGGGDDDADGKAPPVGAHAAPLVKELDRIRNTSASRAWTTYGDLAAQRALGGGTVPTQLQVMSGYGWPTTAERDASVQQDLALNGSKADQVAEVGEEHGAGRFDGGIDTAAILAKAKKLGAKQDGKAGPLTVWRLAPDNETMTTKELVELSRGTADFNVLAADKDALVRAPSGAVARALSADGAKDTLAKDAKFRAVADCLGRPLAATFTDVHIATASSSPAPAGFVTGAGVTGTSATHLTQVACRSTASKDEAEKVAAAVRKELAHGKTRLSGLPWNGMLADAKVTVTGGSAHVVKVTGTSKKSSQLVLEMLRAGDLSDLLAATD